LRIPSWDARSCAFRPPLQSTRSPACANEHDSRRVVRQVYVVCSTPGVRAGLTQHYLRQRAASAVINSAPSPCLLVDEQRVRLAIGRPLYALRRGRQHPVVRTARLRKIPQSHRPGQQAHPRTYRHSHVLRRGLAGRTGAARPSRIHSTGLWKREPAHLSFEVDRARLPVGCTLRLQTSSLWPFMVERCSQSDARQRQIVRSLLPLSRCVFL
jgi:hypothetical protein